MLEAGGILFCIRLFCDKMFHRDTQRVVEVSDGAFCSAAQVYNPFRIVSELDGPVAVSLPVAPPLDPECGALIMSACRDQPMSGRASPKVR